MNGYASLWAIDPSGDELWNKSIPAMGIGGGYGAGSDLSVSIDLDGSLYLAIGGTIHALDPDGEERWNYSGNNGYTRLAIGEEHLFVVDGTYLDILDKDGEWITTYIAGNNRHIYLTPTVILGDNVIILTYDSYPDPYPYSTPGRWKSSTPPGSGYGITHSTIPRMVS